jgi:hypothetical protein
MIVLSLAILSHPDPDEAHLHPSLPLAANCTVVPAPCDRAMGRPACSSQPIVGDVRRKLPFFSLRHNAISTNYTRFYAVMASNLFDNRHKRHNRLPVVEDAKCVILP